MNFQEEIFHKTNSFRIKYPLPPYPPYHQGLYLEEFFCNNFIKNCLSSVLPRFYIPIFWTNIYLKGWINGSKFNNIQSFLDNLPRDKKYFTVCQHDDAPIEDLKDLDIKVYSAGGNYKNGIPIPLICSKMPPTTLSDEKKSIFCSFVGSNTHHVRNKIINYYQNDKDFNIQSKSWQYNIGNQDFQNFVDITKKSIFTICARGYGKQSYRFSEALQLRSIPIYIYDNSPYLPFSDEIDYNEFSVLLNIDNIADLKNILKSKNEMDIENMLTKGQEIYNEYFTLSKVTDKILNSLEK